MYWVRSIACVPSVGLAYPTGFLFTPANQSGGFMCVRNGGLIYVRAKQHGRMRKAPLRKYPKLLQTSLVGTLLAKTSCKTQHPVQRTRRHWLFILEKARFPPSIAGGRKKVCATYRAIIARHRDDSLLFFHRFCAAVGQRCQAPQSPDSMPLAVPSRTLPAV